MYKSLNIKIGEFLVNNNINHTSRDQDTFQGDSGFRENQNNLTSPLYCRSEGCVSGLYICNTTTFVN